MRNIFLDIVACVGRSKKFKFVSVAIYNKHSNFNFQVTLAMCQGISRNRFLMSPWVIKVV